MVHGKGKGRGHATVERWSFQSAHKCAYVVKCLPTGLVAWFELGDPLLLLAPPWSPWAHPSVPIGFGHSPNRPPARRSAAGRLPSFAVRQ